MPYQGFRSVALNSHSRQNKNLNSHFFKKLILILSIFSTCNVATGEICTPFKVHNQVRFPDPPEIILPEFFAPNWETDLAAKIGKINTQNEFPEIYANWLKLHPRELSENERFRWLNCLYYYTSFDTDHDGIPDWSAILDRKPTHILFPQDSDQDGDGIENVLDPQPLQKNTLKNKLAEIPAHLRFDARKRPEATLLQQQIYKEYRILAVDHTDEHSPVVLKQFLLLLQQGFSKPFIKGLKDVKYLYAFAGHSHGGNIASFHWQAQAISVGGMSLYPESDLNDQMKIELLSAFAHELGHAILFEKLKVEELAALSTRFSDWNTLKASQLNASFYSPVLFEAYPQKNGRNFVSQYALLNRHEWFAEATAAALLRKLGNSGGIKTNWQESIKRTDSAGPHFWVNYGRISDEFLDWFKELMKK